jgi:hypothetical protein
MYLTKVTSRNPVERALDLTEASMVYLSASYLASFEKPPELTNSPFWPGLSIPMKHPIRIYLLKF